MLEPRRALRTHSRETCERGRNGRAIDKRIWSPPTIALNTDPGGHGYDDDPRMPSPFARSIMISFE